MTGYPMALAALRAAGTEETASERATGMLISVGKKRERISAASSLGETSLLKQKQITNHPKP